MYGRIASLLGFRKRAPGETSRDDIFFDSGITVPTDGTSGYAIGAIFQHTDGGAGTAFYINEGTATSSTFAAVAGLTAAQEALLSATAGTAEASKALIVDASVDIAGINDLGVDGIATLAQLIYPAAVARTATSDGLTTGTIADLSLLQFITVTSASANNIIVLPTPTPGTIVILACGSNGYELRSSSPATVAISGGTGASAESAIPASSLAIVICETALEWKGLTFAGNGALAQIEAAA